MKVQIVTAPEERTKPGMMPSLVNPAWSAGSPSVTGLYAAVEADGARLEVSRMPGETDWTVDAAYPPGSSCPAFANGFGARYLRTKVVSQEIAATLDAAAPPPAPEKCGAHGGAYPHVCTDLCTASACCRTEPA